jgi:hypothetical protein
VENQGMFRMPTLRGCSHQFSWPRRASSGDYYQVCVLCGDQYSYDWDVMQRLARRPPEPALKTEARRTCGSRWTPRARRMRLSGPIRYRELGSDLWTDGELKNISKSGVLFIGTGPLEKGARVELEFDMPSEICGSIARRVRCDAQVVRTGIGQTADYAAQVFGYVFINCGHATQE